MGGGNSKEKYEEADKKDPDNKVMSGDDWTDLKDKKRGCTDCICLLLILICWIVMTIIGLIVTGAIQDSRLQKGEPARLTNSIDHNGRICGITSSVESRSNGYYMPSGAVVCVSSCPTATDYKQFICYEDLQAEADSDIAAAWTYVSEGVCMYKAKTKEVLNRCKYVSDNNNSSAASDAASAYVASAVADTIAADYGVNVDVGDPNAWYNELFGDIWEMRGYIFGFGLGVSVIFSFLYLYMLRIPGLLTVLIWGIIIIIQLLFIIGSVLLYTLADSWAAGGAKSDTEIMLLRGFSYFGFVCSFLYFCLILILCKRIFLAVSIVKEASKAITAMPLIIFMPILQVVGLVLFLIPWTIFAVFLASSGEVKQVTIGNFSYRKVEYTTNTQYAFLYYLFCYFWTSEFIIAMGQLVIALAVTKWYFTKDKSTVGNGDLIWSFRTAFRYHMGTAAFGSLIIAIIKTIRAIVAYFQKKARDTHNYIMQAVLCCVQCCLYCLEKCMKFINKNAYIQTAIHGYSFCKSARCAFFLILRNVLRVAAVNMVAEFLLLIGKLFVPLATTFICYLVIAYQLPEASTNGLVVPLLVTFTLSYFVASMFAEIFGMAIETILCCYIADEEMFPPEKRFADGGLKTALQKHAEAAAKVNGSTPQVREIQVHPSDEGTANKKEEGGMM
eukprot:CAMPEP_0182417654 /NCGR_PEP_ID=MMETSP1167-20130531/2101_1 /TAXON_ID=2988 /ORGANISM="Mallomonas Sp, Strain CCMP3275" /LENGTH=669 /DNA_ID=CAMNT_0024591357 /DNA_START=108 /DNA_END=2117 /DNA_ORIENTATION=+